MNCVDLFAGAGGWTTGARQAGARVLKAINHWPRAVETHQLNHPETEHVCQDLALYDHSKIPDHDLLIASPSCVGHTPARGKERKHHDATRATAWVVIDVAEVKRPQMIVVENVPHFLKWELYGVWRMALSTLGYAVTEHVFDAADFGTPQERKRVIITAAKRRPLDLFSPGIRGSDARGLIDWESDTWGSTTTRTGRTAGCITHGRATFGDRFLVPYFGSTFTARSLDRPIGTLTTKDRYAAVDGDRMRFLSIREWTAFMGFPADYQLTGTETDQKKQLGNAVPPPLARGVIEQIMRRAA